MRTCPKCKRANAVTRKFCTRCGASLLVSLDEPPSVEKSPAPQIDEVKAEPEETYAAPTESVSATSEDSSVRPSEVDRERLRTTVIKEKTEMEKAREAFSRADEVGIEEADSGIVEVRMLRASEVHELMGETKTEPQPTSVEPAEPSKPATPPMVESPPSPPPETPAVTPPITESEPPRSPVIEPPPAQPETRVEPAREREPPAKLSPERIDEPTAQASKVEVTPKPPVSAATIPTTDASLEKPIPEIDALLSKIPEHLTDDRVKYLTTELTHLHIELRKIKSDLESVSVHLDEEVRNNRNAAEVKRLHFESLEEQLRLAKEELQAAKKEFGRVNNLRDNEVSTRIKRIKEIEKRIGRYEDAILKRGRELQKEKEKLAKQQT
ncbi:MAG: hypothetical protein RTU30_01435 [Candidatus Thorarchaeota archaeon]